MAEQSKFKKQLRLGSQPLFLGVIAGFAEYFDIDATLLRVLFLFLLLITWFIPGVIFYFAAYVIMAKAPEAK